MNLNQESVLALFAAWLRTQAAALGLFFGTLGLCAVFCWLYAAPAAPLLDAAVLCVAGLVGWGACGFARFVRRHRQLAALLSLPALDEHSPEGQQDGEDDKSQKDQGLVDGVQLFPLCRLLLHLWHPPQYLFQCIQSGAVR